ncbi:MAG: MATE family efflux transporter, partial [Eubacteriales bacterium]|nr:MATE family efflux transporter [Eubacteriales bacterium]
MDSKNEFLATEPVGKLLFRLSLPSITAQLINMLYNLVDRIYIGRIPEVGSLALTGVGVCQPVNQNVSPFAALISMGAAPRASIRMGEGKRDDAERILGSCVSLQLILSAVLTAVLLIWNRPLLLAFGASENTIGYASGYLRVYALGTVCVQLTLGMNAFITAQGFAKTGMLTVLIGAVTNIILDPLLIFGCHMGVQGAALATILSQALSAAWAICFLCGKKTTLRIRPKYLAPSFRILAPCLALGLAPFIMQS